MGQKWPEASALKDLQPTEHQDYSFRRVGDYYSFATLMVSVCRDEHAGAGSHQTRQKHTFGDFSMSILIWAVLGLIAGAIARAIYPGHQGLGIIGTMVLGIVGAFVGGAIYNLLVNGTLVLGASAGLGIGSIVVAVLGAIVTLFIYYAVTKRTA